MWGAYAKAAAMPTPDPRNAEPGLIPGELCLEEKFTDLRSGSIRRFTPVKSDGSPDPARKLSYIGELQVLTPAGALPIAFRIEAQSLEEALEKYGPLANAAIEQTERDLEDLRRQASSNLVVPRGAGGGKIQLP